MLYSLRIQNFAIVEHAELQLNSGLTTITGETGAGKSILIDALGLVLGERADSNVVKQGADFAEINAEFSVTPRILAWFQQQNIIKTTSCHIRRLVYANGRSRAFINQQTVSVQQLRDLGEHLVDIHGQHAHQSLLKQEVQRQLLDEVAADKTHLEQVKNSYQQWKSLISELQHLGGNTQDREAKLALLRYQVQELAELELLPETLSQLENEHRRLANAAKLLDSSQHALTLLDADDQNSTLSYLHQASHELSAVQQHDSRLNNVLALLENAIIQAQEATGELRSYIADLDIDPQHLQQIDDKLMKLQDMARKHKVRFHELPGHFEKLNNQLNELENYEQRANELEANIAKIVQQYRLVAKKLHQQRVTTAQGLQQQITENMRQLGMPAGQLVIVVDEDEYATPSANGIDLVEFLVSTNPGHAPRALNKVASGGELSRISLAIQVITAQYSGVPTLVFDEVDVGIGGGVAEIVGKLLLQLGQQRQVLCITHLPQVACQGVHHLQVNKIIEEQQTYTALHWLTAQQRIEEIARMLGGLEITPQTLAHAKEMLAKSQLPSSETLPN
ncbi:MAG: DNA repair protein RecN [Thiotrichaceae bacterium]